MRTGKLRVAMLALAVGAALVATAASAVVLEGRGEVHAMGSGLAVFDMAGVLVVRGGGLLIADESARVEVEGIGRQTSLGDGRVLFEGFGRAVVASREPTRIEIAGAKLRLHAKGAGRALLKGCGVVQTDDQHTRWEAEALLEFEPGEE